MDFECVMLMLKIGCTANISFLKYWDIHSPERTSDTSKTVQQGRVTHLIGPYVSTGYITTSESSSGCNRFTPTNKIQKLHIHCDDVISRISNLNLRVLTEVPASPLQTATSTINSQMEISQYTTAI
jgi:hypothetical protein